MLLKNVQGIIQSLVQDSVYYSKMSRVLFNVWFRIQHIMKKCPWYYSVSGSGFSVLVRVLFIIQPAYYSASSSGFRVLFKNVQGIIQRLVQDSGYYSKYDQQHLVQDSTYY